MTALDVTSTAGSTVISKGTISLGNVNSANEIFISNSGGGAGATITTANLTSQGLNGGDGITVNGQGNVVVGDVHALSFIQLTSNEVGSLIASGDLTSDNFNVGIIGGGNLNLGNISSFSDFILNATNNGSIQTGSIYSENGKIALTANSLITTGDLEAFTDVSVANTSVAPVTIGNVTTHSGKVDIHTVGSNSTESLKVGTVSAVGQITIAAQNGSLKINDLSSMFSTINLSSSENITAGVHYPLLD